jgi:hypothetical protein
MKKLFVAAVACLALFSMTGCVSPGDYASTFTGEMSVSEARSAASAPAPAIGYGPAFDRPAESESSREKPYFIEFRARGAVTYGHACVVFGKLDENGRVPVDERGWLIPSMTEITGLHPVSNDLTVGHVIPVPAKTGPSAGDQDSAYIARWYRIKLTEEEFKRVVALIKCRKRRTHVWYGPTQNCVTYVRAIARDLGLEVPGVMHLPAGFVTNLERLNSEKE